MKTLSEPGESLNYRVEYRRVSPPGGDWFFECVHNNKASALAEVNRLRKARPLMQWRILEIRTVISEVAMTK